MTSNHSTNDILNLYGGEFAKRTAVAKLLPKDFINELFDSARPLCESVSISNSKECKLAIVATESWIVNSHMSSDGDCIICISIGTIVRLKQFLELSMLYDGIWPSMVLIHTELIEQFDEWNDPPPKLLRPILGDYRDPADFWNDRKETQREIEFLYKSASRVSPSAIWQIVLLSCLHLVAHEACHLMDHHECILKHLKTSPDSSMSANRARIAVELVADGFAARMLSKNIIAHCSNIAPEILAPMFSFWTYGVSSLYRLWDAQKSILKGATRDGADATAEYPHPSYRCRIIYDCAIQQIAAVDSKYTDLLCQQMTRVTQELDNNMACILQLLVARGELTVHGALRLPGFNQFANGSRAFAIYGEPNVENGYNRLLNTWREFNLLWRRFREDNLAVCKVCNFGSIE